MKNNETNPYGYKAQKEKAEEIFNQTLEILNNQDLDIKENIKAIFLLIYIGRMLIINLIFKIFLIPIILLILSLPHML